MSEEVGRYEDRGRDYLDGDVPAGANEAEDHTEGEEDAECEDHEQDV